MLGKYVFIAVICAVFHTSTAKVAKITDCSSVFSNSSSFPCQVTETRIEPCKNEAFCKIKLNEDAALSFDFIPGFDAEKLKVAVFYSGTQFPGLDGDACKGTSCPIEKGKKQTFSTKLHIGARLPTGSYNVYWTLKNEDNEAEMCCFMTKLRLAKGKN